MKKRPKLSLSAGKEVDKKQALDFENSAPAEPEIPPAEVEKPRARAPAPRPEIRARPPVSTERNRSEGDDIPSRPKVNARAGRTTVDSRPSQPKDLDKPRPSKGRQIVKTLLVVAVAALSLYLLKRRFF